MNTQFALIYTMIIKERNINLLLLIAVLFVSHLNLYAQSSNWSAADAKAVKDAGEQWDERGYGKGHYIDTEGDLSISNANGNVMYNYPISSRTIHGKPIVTTLNYCGSVTYSAIGPFMHSEGSPGYHKSITQEHPAWIFGVNGFAVQMVGAAGNLYIHPSFIDCWDDNYPNDPCQTVSTKENKLNWVVEGYDYCNPLSLLNNSNTAEHYDCIKILRADGSKLELRNPLRNSTSLAQNEKYKLLTGIYYENGINAKGYAIVEFIDEEMPAFIDNYLDTLGSSFANVYGTNGKDFFKNRRVRYFPGDGLEYVFEEWVGSFGLTNAYNNSYWVRGDMFALGNYRVMPRTFYLAEVKSDNRTLIQLRRSRHYNIPFLPVVWDNDYEQNPEARGRALLMGFEDHNFHYYPNQIIVEALGATHVFKFDSVITDSYGHDINYSKGIDWARFVHPNNWYTKLPADHNDLYRSWTGYITKIVDPVGRVVNFGYQSYRKQFLQYRFPIDRLDNQYNKYVLRQSRLHWVEDVNKFYKIFYSSNPDTSVNYNEGGMFSQNGLNTRLNNVANQLVKKGKQSSNGSTEVLAYTKYFFNDNLTIQGGVGNLPNTSLQSWSYTVDALTNLASITESANTVRLIAGVTGSTQGSNDPHLTHQTPAYVRTWKFKRPTSYAVTTDQNGSISDNLFDNGPSTLLSALSNIDYERKDVTVSEANVDTVNSTITRFLIHPIRKKTISTEKKSGQSAVDLVTSLQKIDYTAEKVRFYNNNEDVSDQIGWEIKTDTVISFIPNDTNTVLLKHVSTYRNLPQDNNPILMYDTWWDKHATLTNYHEKRAAGDSDYINKSWENAICEGDIIVWINDTLEVGDFMQPIFGVKEKEELYDANGILLSGKKSYVNPFIYQASDDPQNPNIVTHTRGSILGDTLYGYGGIMRPLNKYLYSLGGAFNGAGLLERTENIFGARHFSRYDFMSDAFIRRDPYNSSCLNYEPPVYYVLTNMDGVDSSYLRVYENSIKAEKPIMDESIVRKYNSAGTLVKTSIANLFEYGRYGLVTKSVDPNGWLSAFNYDYIGRMTSAVLPADFADKNYVQNQSIVPTYNAKLRLVDYGCTHYRYQVERMTCTYVQPNDTATPYSRRKVCLGEWVEKGCYDPRLFVEKVPYQTYEWECSCGENQIVSCDEDDGDEGGGGGSSIKTGNKGGNQTKGKSGEEILHIAANCTYTQSLPQYEEYKGNLRINLEEIKDYNGVSAVLDSVRLSLFITSITGNNVVLKINLPQLNITQTYTFTAQNNEPNASVNDPFLTILLDSYASTLLSLANNDEMLEVRLWTTTTGGRIDFANVGDDTKPALETWGKYPRRYSLKDFTLYNNYNDTRAYLLSEVQSYSKIDDALHSSNDLSFYGYARYAQERQFFGADWMKLRSEQDMYSSLHQVTDTSRSHFGYNGFGQLAESVDPLNYVSYTRFDGSGEVAEKTMPYIPTIGSDPNDTSVIISRSMVNPSTIPALSDQNFYGLCDITETTDPIGRKSVTYADVFGRVRREIADADSLALTTKYEYDVQGRLKKVISPKNDTTRYWYDEFGKVKYKHHPDMGFQSFAYDDVGNVRFAQTAVQKQNQTMSFMQYDDIGRISIIGEVHLPLYMEAADPAPTVEDDTLNLNRWTDKLDPNRLHDNDSSAIPTANKTLWMGNYNNAERIPMVQDTTQCFPYRIDNGSDKLMTGLLPVFPSLQRTPVVYPPIVGIPMVILDTNGFEDISTSDFNVRVSIIYDEIPERAGKIWGLCPPQTMWNALAPKAKFRNLVGKQAAIAYRDAEREAFHFMMFSYDERGRIEAQIRYTENIGWDALYYEYNSSNALHRVTVADAWNTSATWYGYDRGGRLVSTWSKLKNTGIGFSSSTPMLPDTLNRPTLPEAQYTYDKRGSMVQTFLPHINTTNRYFYNGRALIDSMATFNMGGIVFTEALGWRGDGQIMRKSSTFFGTDNTVQEYSYDRVNRLEEWQNQGGTPTAYSYDNVGNRLSETGAEPKLYQYYPNTNRLKQYSGTNGYAKYEYDKNGATVSRTRVKPVNTSNNIYSRTKEYFDYNYAGLTRSYFYQKSFSTDINDTCFDYNPTWDIEWEYRYGGGGERERKRMVSHPSLSEMSGYTPGYGTVPGWTTGLPWTYYLLDGGQRQHAVYEGRYLMTDVSSECDTGAALYWVPAEYLIHGTGDVPYLSLLPNGDKRYRIQDNLGSTRVVFDSSGALYQWTSYEPFGKTVPGNPETDRLSWIGKEKDEESDLGDFGVRKYDEETGRFLSTDPIWEKYRFLSPYNYCNNDPLRYVDPTGFGEDEVNKAAQDVQATMTEIEKQAEANKEGNTEFGATGVRQPDGTIKMSDIVKGEGEGQVAMSVSGVDVSIHSHTPFGQPTTSSKEDILKIAFTGAEGSIHFITAGDGNRVALEVNDSKAAKAFAETTLRGSDGKLDAKNADVIGFQIMAGIVAQGGKLNKLSVADVPTETKSKGVATVLKQNDTGMSIYVQNNEGTYEKK